MTFKCIWDEVCVFSRLENRDSRPCSKLQVSYSLEHPPQISLHSPLIGYAIFKVCRQSRKTFLFLFCFLLLLFFLLRSADKVGRPFCFCSVFSFFYSFLFFSTATCVSRFLRDFSTNLHEIWHVDSPWWDEQTEYFFKSIGPGVGTGRGPKVLLCFIIGKTLYTVRRDKNFT